MPPLQALRRQLPERITLAALIDKELLQISRDRSILLVAFVLPLILIFITGFGLNMDIRHVAVGLHCERADQHCDEFYAAFCGTGYFDVARYLTRPEAVADFEHDRLDALVLLRRDFTPRLLGRGEFDGLVYINASHAQKATIVNSYLQATLASALQQTAATQAVTTVYRSRFNEASISAHALVPGNMIGTITLICAFMCSLIIAREYDRNTVLFMRTARVSALSVLLSKLMPYYVLAVLGTITCIAVSVVVFELPFRGSLFIFAVTVLVYCLMASCLGLLISAVCRSTFLASEYAILLSMMPSLILSGAIFDLKAVARFIYYIAMLLPMTHAVRSFKICFMSGGQLPTLWLNIAILLGFAVVFFAAAWAVLHRGLR